MGANRLNRLEWETLCKILHRSDFEPKRQVFFNHPELLNRRYAERTVLIQAIEEGELKILRKMLELGANPNFLTHNDYDSPLMFACMRLAKNVVEILLEYGADPELPSGGNRNMPKMLFVFGSLTYAVLNVFVTLAYAMSYLGPTQFELLWCLLGVSIIASFAAQFVTGPEIDGWTMLGVSALFAALVGFNTWVLFVASAAV